MTGKGLIMSFGLLVIFGAFAVIAAGVLGSVVALASRSRTDGRIPSKITR